MYDAILYAMVKDLAGSYAISVEPSDKGRTIRL